MNHPRQQFLGLKKKLGKLTPAEQTELDSFPLIIQGTNFDGTPAGCLVIPQIPGDTEDERLVNFLSAGQNKTPDEVRQQIAVDKAIALAKSTEPDTDQVTTPKRRKKVAADQATGDELPVQEFELDGRGNRVPVKHQPWIRPATSWDLAGNQ